MADPLSIISLIEGSVGLILQCGSVAKSLGDIAGKFKQAKLSAISMKVEVNTVEFAWTRIKKWTQLYAGVATDTVLVLDFVDPTFLERLDQSLECGTLVMSALQEDLSTYTESAETLSFPQRSRLIWNEKALQDHQHRIRGQVLAMTLLIQALELPTPEGRSQLLQTEEYQLRRTDESAYSIIPSRMSSRSCLRLSKTLHARDSRISIESADLVYRRLSSEDDLFTTAVYKRNHRPPRRSLTKSKIQVQIRDSESAVNDIVGVKADAKFPWNDVPLTITSSRERPPSPLLPPNVTLLPESIGEVPYRSPLP